MSSPRRHFSTLCLITALGLFACGVSSAQHTALPKAPNTAPAATAAPEGLIRNPPAQYPALSKRHGEQGRVEVKVRVDAQGTPIHAEVGYSSGYPRLDASALEAVMRWRFPHVRNRDGTQSTWAFAPFNFFFDGPELSPPAWNSQAAAVVRSHFRLAGASQFRSDSPASFFVDVLPDGTISDKFLHRSSGMPGWDNTATQILDKVLFPPNRHGLLPRKALVYMASNRVDVTPLAGWQEQGQVTEKRYEERVAVRIQGRLGPPEAMPDHLRTDVEMSLSPDGGIIGKRLAQSSGNKQWDDAVLSAIDRTRFVPRDIGGRVPPSLTIAFSPRS